MAIDRSLSAAQRALSELNEARDQWVEACRERGCCPFEQSSAILSIGREYLPVCAKRALKGGSLPVAIERDLYVWLREQLEEG